MTPVERPRKTRKEALLDAVIDSLLSTGFNDLSLRALSAQVHTSHRVLLYHFKTKENLIAELVQEVRRREWLLFEEQEKGGNPSLAELLQRFFDHNTSEPMQRYFRLFYEVWGIAQNHPDRYTKFLDGIVDGWVEALSAALVEAGCSPDQAEVNATLVLGSLRGLQLDLLTTHDRSRVTRAFAHLVDLIRTQVAATRESPVALPGSGQRPAEPEARGRLMDAWRNDEAVAAEVAARFQGWIDCNGRGDLAALRGYLHPDFVYVSVFGRRYDRDGYVALAGSLVPDAHYDIRRVRARVLGDIAEVDGEYSMSSVTESGEDLTAETRFTACWVRNGPGGNWVALTHHGTRYDPAVDPGAASGE